MPSRYKGGICGILVELVDGLRLDVGELFRRRRGVSRLHVLHLDERGVANVGPAVKTRREREVIESAPRLALVAHEVRSLRGSEERDERASLPKVQTGNQTRS